MEAVGVADGADYLLVSAEQHEAVFLLFVSGEERHA